MRMPTLFALTALLGAALLGTGCLFQESKEGSGSGKVLVLASDNKEASYLIAFDLEDSSFGDDTLLTFKNALLKKQSGRVFVLERSGNILKVDPENLRPEGLIYHRLLKENSNPTDVWIHGDDKGYVTPENDSAIYVIDPGTGEIQKEIGTGDYIYQPSADSGLAAATPHAVAVAEWREMIYVLLQRRNGHGGFPGGPAKLLRIDPETDSIVGVIDLKGVNPQNMALSGDYMYLSVPGAGGGGATGAGGGIEKLDLENETSEMIISDADLGGSPFRIHHQSGDLFYVTVVLPGSSEMPVRLVDFAAGDVVHTLDEVGDGSGGLLFLETENRVLAGDRATPSGIRIFDGQGTQVGGPFSPGLPPAGLTLL